LGWAELHVTIVSVSDVEGMVMTYHGKVKNGVVVLDEAARLPEGAEVRVDLVNATGARPSEDESPTLYERLKPFIGAAKGLPPDASVNVDHYLYGLPKK
jgi:hypothetical protein